MTLNEFKAFLEGMDIQNCPTPEQWARIADKLASVKPEEKYLPAPVQPLMPPPRWDIPKWNTGTPGDPTRSWPQTICDTPAGSHGS